MARNYRSTRKRSAGLQRRLKKWLWLGLLTVVGVPLLGSVLLVSGLRFIDPPVWAWQLQRQISPPANYPQEVRHQWVPLAQIAKPMQLAVIASEDQKFPQHFGLDLESIERALQANRDGGRVRGASTLSQQTAKNLFLWPAKSYIRKGIEAWFALLLELICGKERILETYLNIAEFGPGIFGVEAASQHYFNRPARELSGNQAARLAAVLPNPYRLRVQPLSHYMAERTDWIQRQMRQLGLQTLAQLN
ncbi:monofunctional biosynthetic peptidoglycan transglycosylase [Marinobacterium sp. CAU 1594]|nr:monofunctional biosynthetic peptidoglycan transglycosylase [Marinobacterium arenosum]